MKNSICSTLLFSIWGFIVISGCTDASEKTLLIKNAIIVDGSGSERFPGAVRILNKKIIAVGDLKKSVHDSVIDAKGLVLSPGFIDTHSHHDWGSDRNKEAAISQGVTTIIVGQDGDSFYPLQKLFDSLQLRPLSVNLASYSGHNTIRDKVMGEDYKREASHEEIDSMQELLLDDLQAGALGLSTGLEYDPGIYSTTEEVIALAGLVKKHKGNYISHLRSEDHLEQGLEEIIRIGRETGIPVQISHFKMARKGLWGEAPRFLNMLDSARMNGIDITADVYPYEYWQSTMTVLFPKRDFDNRESVSYALTELTSPEFMIIDQFDAEPSYEGLTLDSIASLRKEDPVTTYIKLIELSQKKPSESVIAKSMDMKDIITLTQWPYTNIGSDGAVDGHPRGWGAFTRFLNLETGLSLEEKIRKMTLQAAENLDLKKIGSIKVGNYADLVLFDPETVKDRATYENSTEKSAGIEMVMVSGKVVYQDLKSTGQYPGRIIKLQEK